MQDRDSHRRVRDFEQLLLHVVAQRQYLREPEAHPRGVVESQGQRKALLAALWKIDAAPVAGAIIDLMQIKQ